MITRSIFVGYSEFYVYDTLYFYKFKKTNLQMQQYHDTYRDTDQSYQ